MSLVNFNKLDYEGILDKCFEIYVHDFGENKFQKVFRKAIFSEKITEFIWNSEKMMVAPSPDDILETLNTIPFFIFSRNETQAIAGLIVLQRWHEMTNTNQHLLNENELRLRAIGILNKYGMITKTRS